LVIRPSVCAFEQGETIAAWTAASSLLTPLANEANQTCSGSGNLWSKFSVCLFADHGMEIGDDLPRLNQQRDATFNSRNCDSFGLGECVSAGCQQPCYRSGKRNSFQAIRISLLGTPSAHCLLADNTHGGAEYLETAPKFRVVVMACRPLAYRAVQGAAQASFPGHARHQNVDPGTLVEPIRGGGKR